MFSNLRYRIQIFKPQLRLITIIIILLLVIGFILIANIFQWEWTGLAGYYNKTVTTTIIASSKESITTTLAYQPPKTMWDWMNFIFVGLVTMVAASLTIVVSDRQKKTELEIASDKQHEDALQSYIDKISELLLHEDLRKSKPEEEVRTIASIRTLTVLSGLDGKRKGIILKFLYDSGLIVTDPPIIDLHGADLSNAKLFGVDLHGVKLQGAKLVEADMRRANLRRADLSGANLGGYPTIYFNKNRYVWHTTDLSEADLSEANLTGANLTLVNLHNALVTDEQLNKAKSLEGITMPNGKKHSGQIIIV
jgi:hypothetical protein